MCRQNRPDLAAVDVNSSPNSVGVYKRLGFLPVGSGKNGKRDYVCPDGVNAANGLTSTADNPTIESPGRQKTAGALRFYLKVAF